MGNSDVLPVLRPLRPGHSEVQRKSANCQTSTWSYDFVQSLRNDYYVLDHHELQNKVKKVVDEDVRSMINNNENPDLLAKLELIDEVQRLGLGYRFEKEITRALDNGVLASNSKGYNERIVKSLHATALSFRLLRQRGSDVSQDEKSNFKESCLGRDVKGMLSLYEASYLGFEGENLLDEAMKFARVGLEDFKIHVSKSVAEQIQHALEVPLHHRMQRLEACLGPDYDSFVTSVTTRVEPLSIEDLYGHLLAYEK
ncbi:isoprene synthase, chloroplastic-like [Juglans regia]|uniref:Isoprene synthase, chloroplastic-like n=1 Tax=Juglans regia TaxID=51240 RepID=A0A6P9EF05_JUGRE|nr:isoprene synthase, chloroplastic-like [Juglans regia]